VSDGDASIPVLNWIPRDGSNIEDTSSFLFVLSAQNVSRLCLAQETVENTLNPKGLLILQQQQSKFSIVFSVQTLISINVCKFTHSNLQNISL